MNRLHNLVATSVAGASVSVSHASPDEFAWVFESLPAVLPAGWHEVERKLDGVTYRSKWGLLVIVSGDTELDGKRWIHLSMSRANRLPSYDDMVQVKELFIGRDRTALQVFPPRHKHINIMPYCLHLWCCADGEVTPDFTRGGRQL